MPAPEGPKLVVHLSDGSVQEHELIGDETHIGRDPACEVQIASPYVSRKHAVISMVDGRHVLWDEHSTNGLQINGRLVREPHPLVGGDRVVIGDISITYHEEVADSSVTAVYVASGGPGSTPLLAGLGSTRLGASSEHGAVRRAGLCTILFTDLVDHTREVTRLGDVAGQHWLRRHTAILREQFEQHEGLEEKWTGDGFLVTFASARQAVQCAIAAQQALHDHNLAATDAPIHVRIGLNTGEVLREGDELFGNAVIMASRVMSEAGPDEILISDLMQRLIQPAGEFTVVDRGLVALKGFEQEQRLYTVDWQASDSKAD